MGGGSLMTPILVFIFGIPPSTAIGTDIAHGAVFKTVGAAQHRRMGNVRARLAGWMLIGSIPASLVGVWLNEQLTDRYGDEAKSVMGQVLGAALLFGAVGLIAKSLVQPGGPRAIPTGSSRRATRSPRSSSALFGGFIVGLTSVGSGVFFGLTLLVVFPLRAHKVVGTDIFHAAILLYVAGAAHWAAGNIDFGILGWLLLGSIPGVLIGGRLTLSIPEQRLRLLLAGSPRPRRDQAARRPVRRDDRRRRAVGRRRRAPRLARASQLDPLRARPRRAAPSARSRPVASRGDAHGLGQLRHDRPRLPRGGGGVWARRSSASSRCRARSTRTARVSARSTRLRRGWAPR